MKNNILDTIDMQILGMKLQEARAEILRQHIKDVTDDTNFDFDMRQLFGSGEDYNEP
ncbi:MAG: hypothetical protein ABI406_18730 [Ktedonobacteraceae bacterium]